MSLILDQAIEVRVEGETVVIEPPEIHGVRGFEIRLTPDRARKIRTYFDRGFYSGHARLENHDL